MPRKKTVTTVPEEPLAENQEGLSTPAETSETEGISTFPDTGDTAPAPDGEAGEFPHEDDDPATQAEDAAFPPDDSGADPFPDTESGDFPPDGSPFSGGDAGSGEENSAGELGDTPDGAPKDGDNIPDSDSPFEGDYAESNIQGEEAPATDPEYDALLHEWSEVGGEQAHDSEEPLVLAPPPGPEPEPLMEAEEPPAPANDTADATPRAARPRRRTPASGGSPAPTASRRSAERERVLTIEARDEVQSEDDQEAAIWHEIQNADWTRRILTGTLDGVEQTESGLTLAVVSYKGFRVAIPIKEMMLHSGKLPTGQEYQDTMDRLRRILMTRLGSEIDFVVKGHDNKSRSAVGSRKDAMLRKRQSFYLDKDALGESMIYEGRVVQARVVAVAEKIIRVEVFGVECAIVARGLSRSWVGDAAEQYSVGDRILVRVLKISGSTAEDLAVTVDVRSVFKDGSQENLKKCIPQGRYAGRVTDIRGGVVYIRLNNGVNAIAHSCYDRRTPGKRDDVSFSVTRLDPEQGVAVGIITRIIKQNL